MHKISDVEWYSLIDTLLGELDVEYELDVTDNQIKILATPTNALVVRNQLEKALSDLGSVLPYTIEMAPLQETVPEALSTFKALLGDGRFSDIAINPDELFNEKKGAQITDGILYSKTTKHKRTISVWTNAVNALITDLQKQSRRELKASWENKTPIPRQSFAESQGDINYEEIVTQNFGLHVNAQQEVSVFFNFRQLWQDLFVPELAIESNVIAKPTIHTSTRSDKLVIHKAQLLDYLRQELHSDVLWRVFKSGQGPMATPLYLDTTNHAHRQTKVSVVIDRSGSMQNIFDALTNNILTFINKLEPNTEVNILFFDSTIGPRKTFFAHQQKDIKSFVKSLKPNGETHLYTALNHEFSELIKKAAPGDNTAILLLTDGQDSLSNPSATIENILSHQKSFQAKQVKIPKIFTIGIGTESSIQKLDSRLPNERLIINNIAEFEKVFRYIKEIQYPTHERSLVVTQKPKDLSSYKVTVEQNGNVQSPDIYVTFAHSRVGIIQGAQKQIIHLKTNLPQSNIHDAIKYYLSSAREAMVSGPSTRQKGVSAVKQQVVDLSKTVKNSNQKLQLEALIDYLETRYINPKDQSHQNLLIGVQLEQGYVKQAIYGLASFSMEYETTLPKRSSELYSGAMLRKAPLQYNIAGKLISSLYDSPPETASLVQMTTSISDQQNQMTVHALDKTQKEQSRVYAFCTPYSDEFNEISSLYCQGDSFQGFVFPHSTHVNINGDNYNFKSCRPISYYDQPSVVCEGENSSIVITPKLPDRPLENLGANIALGAVLFQMGKSLYNALTAPRVPKTYFTDQPEFDKKIKQLKALLKKTKKKIEATQPFDGDKFHFDEIKHFFKDIEWLEQLFSKGRLEESKLKALGDEIKDFKESMHHYCDEIVQERKNRPKPITYRFTFERQRDWSMLIQKPSVNHHNNGLPKLR